MIPQTYVLVTGGFDPIHSGHISYFKSASKLGDKLVIGLNSDAWLTRKKGKPFMPFNERRKIIEELKCVNTTIDFDDNDGSAVNAIQKILCLMDKDDKLIFANGGDRLKTNIPEMNKIKDDRLEFVFGVGGEEKKNSSSWILEQWQNNRTNKKWGYYDVFKELSTLEFKIKVKLLHLEQGQSISMQKHNLRHELWLLVRGGGHFYKNNDDVKAVYCGMHLYIEQNNWHKIEAFGDTPLEIIEIQYGEECNEEDIERKEYASS